MPLFEKDTELEQELSTNPPRIPAFAGRNYPIEYLDSREFEILIYLLFKHDVAKGVYNGVYDTVMLMKGTAERGRDSILRFRNKNVGVIQCKRFISLISVPELCREIIKFSIHAILDKSLIDDIADFTYHFTALKGINETAVEFVKDFNKSILEDSRFEKWVNQVIEENESFNGVGFDALKADLNLILKNIKLKFLYGVDIDSKLKNAKEVVKLFFEVDKVADEEMLHKVFGRYWDFQNDEDLNKLREQLKDIPEESRLKLGHFSIYGYSHEYYKKLINNSSALKQIADITLICSQTFIDYLNDEIDKWILLFVTGISSISPFTKQVVKPYLFNKYARIHQINTSGEFLYNMRRVRGVVEQYQTIEEHKEHLLEMGQHYLSGDFSSWAGDDDLLEFKKKIAAFIHAGFSNTQEMSDRFDTDMQTLSPIISMIEQRIQSIMPVNPTIVIENHSPMNSDEDFVRILKNAGKYN